MVLNFILFLLFTFSISANEGSGMPALHSNDLTASAPVWNSTDTGKQRTRLSPIPMDKFIGANAFIDDPIDKMLAVGFIREYHRWHWDENNPNGTYAGYPNNQIKWAPSAIRPWDFDKYYTAVTQAGLEIAPCIHGNVKWLQGQTNFPPQDKPVDTPGASATNPDSYQAKSHHIFQFAARYGSNKVADSLLTLAPDQPRNTGMGLIRYVEDWNEQDGTWQGPNACFSPQEYAAMASADYDGHANTMTSGSGTFGVKNADPSIKLVMGGLAYRNLDYIKKMNNWFIHNRPDKRFAVDVINVHLYGWLDESRTWRGGGPAISPEASDFKGKMKPWVNFRDQFLPNVEVWVSEFGWDTNPQSPLCPPAIGPFDAEEVQAQWLVRAYLALAAAGVDRAQMYMLRDVDPNSATWYSTCGLVGPKGSWHPKKSWYYVSTLKNTLQNMVYAGEVTSADPNIIIYKFKSLTGNHGAYAVWAKTSSNYRVNDYKLKLPSSPSSASLVKMKAGDADGVRLPLVILEDSISFTVSERPVFVLVDKI